MPYFPQGHTDFNYLRHLILMYGDARRPWRQEDLRYYVAHLDRNGRPDDWLYDSFLFLNVKSSSGRDYCADINLGTTMAGEGDYVGVCSPQPANKNDWEELLGFYFGPAGAIETLDRTIDVCSKALSKSFGPKRNVVLMLPYPHITQQSFGPIGGEERVLDFSTNKQGLMKATQDRLEAERWFVDEIVKRFREGSFRHVNLLGVYWMFETVHRGWDVDDHWLLKELHSYLGLKGLKFLWIPYWSSYNVHLLDDYQSYYFDLAFLQPNYMFYKEGKTLLQAALAARKRNAGIELEYYLELNEPITVVGERHARFREYLNGGVTYGYMTHAVCAHFQGVGALERMHTHADPIEREFYEDIYHFVKGDYQLKPSLVSASIEANVRGNAALSVDLGGTTLRIALVDSHGKILWRESVHTPKTKESILEKIILLLNESYAEAKKQRYVVQGIGVSMGGRVNFETGEVVDSTAILPDWQNVPLREILNSTLGLPIWVDNDGNCAAVAEQVFGKGRGISNFIALVIGTGIGGGVVVGDRILRGASNAAAELGHLSIQYDGPICSCGNRGCVELFASGSGLTNLTRRLLESGTVKLNGVDPEEVNAEWLGLAARNGNGVARQLIEQAGASLGVAIIGLLNTFNPQRVILRGRLMKLGDLYVQPLKETVRARTMKIALESVDFVVSDLEEPGLLGAAGLVFQEAGL